MRVLISRNSPNTLGGAELSALDQARVLKAMGHSVLLVTNYQKLRSRAHHFGLTTNWLPRLQHDAGTLRYPLFILLLPLGILRALYVVWRWKPDVINPHSRDEQVVFTLTKPLHRTAVVWKDPGDLRHMLKEDRTSGVAGFYQRMLIRALNKADGIYFLNPSDLEYVGSFMNHTDHCTTVPASILFQDYTVSAPKKPHSKITIGYIGRLEERKGVFDLIDAFAKLKDHADYTLEIVGDGTDRRKLEQQAAGLPIRFFGHQTDTSQYFNRWDIFAIPSHFEGWGKTVKEAMYFGKPLVGSNTGGIALQVTHNETGLLFAPGNVTQLAKQLQRLVEDPTLRKRIGVAARKKALEDGDFSTVVKKQILPLYEQVVGEEATT